MALIMVVSFVGCGATENNEYVESGTEQKNNSESSAPLEVDEKLFNVDVTLPASYFEGMTEEEIKSAAKESGFINCEINSDGSVKYTMSKAKHREMLEELKTNAIESFDKLTSGDEKVASFIEIKYNDDFSKIDVFVDPNLYSSWDSFYVLSFYILGAYYQMFAGVDAEKIDVIVNFINNETQEVFESASYREYINNLNSEG